MVNRPRVCPYDAEAARLKAKEGASDAVHYYNHSPGRRKQRPKRRVQFKIPPTIHEVDEEEIDEDCGENAPSMDLSATRLKKLHSNRSYRKSKYLNLEREWDYSDSNSDASAKTHDSLRVHTSQNVQSSGRSGSDQSRPHSDRKANMNQKIPCSKVQTIARLLDRIGSASSFNSSEGPSDSSKHNMKVWENAFRCKKSNRSSGFNLKKLFSFSSSRSKQDTPSKQNANFRHMLDKRIKDVRKLSL